MKASENSQRSEDMQVDILHMFYLVLNFNTNTF